MRDFSSGSHRLWICQKGYAMIIQNLSRSLNSVIKKRLRVKEAKTINEISARNPNLNSRPNPRLSRFIIQDVVELKNNDLVYVKYDEGKLDFIIPVQISRQMYEHSLGEMLPEHLHQCTDYQKLCPACRLFGWVKGQENEDKAINKDNGNNNVAYASRVSFEQAELVHEVKGESNVVLAELASPKPTSTFFYLLDKNDRRKFVSKAEGFNPKEQHLRGRKFYWHHNSFAWQRGVPTKRNRTIIDPVHPRSTFKFRIRYENLLPEELGALIWSIQLDKGMSHRLGFGKPLGLGSGAVTIKEGFNYDFEKRYFSLNADGREQIELSYFTEEFKKTFTATFNIKYEDSDTIKDLDAILKEHPNLPIHYPRLSREHNLNGDRNFDWFRNASKGKILGLASEDKGLPI